MNELIQVLELVRDHPHKAARVYRVIVKCCGRVEEKRWGTIVEWRQGKYHQCRACGRKNKKKFSRKDAFADTLPPEEAEAANNLAQVMRAMVGLDFDLGGKRVAVNGTPKNPWAIGKRATEDHVTDALLEWGREQQW